VFKYESIAIFADPMGISFAAVAVFATLTVFTMFQTFVVLAVFAVFAMLTEIFLVEVVRGINKVQISYP
jgi:hypothetical protein